MIQKCDYFIIEEIVSEVFYNENIKKYGDNLWFLFDYHFLITLDRLRKRFGRTNMNNWKWGGKDNSRGYRAPDDSVGAKLSQHRFGRGGDPWFSSVTADEVREDIIKYPDHSTYEFITTIEDEEFAPTWFHFDTRCWDKTKDGILVVKPI